MLLKSATLAPKSRSLASVLIFTLAVHRQLVRITSASVELPVNPINNSIKSAAPDGKAALFSKSSPLQSTSDISFFNSTLKLDRHSDLPSIDRKYFHISSKDNFVDSSNKINTKMTSLKFNYPNVERNESLIEKIFDVDVSDPYRALENPQAEVTKEFITKQNEITEPFLNSCSHRARIKAILTENQDYKKIGCPFKRGNKYYFFMNSGLQPQSVLYQQDSLDSEPKLFFDPNKLSDDGTVALSLTSFSPNGQYFAYGLSYSGSDWVEIGIKDVNTGKDFDEKLKRAKFTSVEWTHDDKGFFYAQYPKHGGDTEGTETDLNENHTVFYHTLGTKQTEDVVKVNFPDSPKLMVDFLVSHDGKQLHVFPKDGCQDNEWFYCELGNFSVKDKLELKPIYDKMEAEFEYISNNDDTVYFRTNLNAKNYRVVKLDLKNPDSKNWVDVIPNHPQDVLDWAEIYTVDQQDYILVNYLRKVVYYLELHKLEGEVVKKFNTPPGTIAKYSGRRMDREIFFQFTSFLTPGQTYHFDLTKLNDDIRLLRQSQPKNFNAEEYVIDQVFYKSKDGTEVPMFLVHRKGLVKDGSNPCLLYGYGGFNYQLTSAFNINRISWIKNFRGILAVANIRGGGELGQNWHDSGRLLNKQNTFDDFVAAAEYLIDAKYTNRGKLAIEGGSNGGLLVAATSNQRPDLFGATICHVGVLDMIRFTSFTIGHAWTSDYGDPKDKKHFNNLIKYSPYHNIPESTSKYPATLLLTADHDDRVVPAHSLKFIAQLQYKLGKKLPDTPLLIRVDTKAGHGSGRPVSKVIDECTDIYSFLYNTLKLENYYNDS